jgi:2-dehydro-3-deoxyphosphooctonate aldolase (KDO 8-P synthase)
VSEKLKQTVVEPFEVGSATFGDGRLTLIAGPCVVESRQHALFMARECRERALDAGLDYVFKASYDKANRSSGSSYRGPGMREGLEALRAVKEETGLPVLTDVHDISQVEEAARVADVLQIPAFLCRQTDLIVAACETGKTVNVKKGQFLAPHDCGNIVEKLRRFEASGIMLTERGTTFGYNALIVDMAGLETMASFGVPVCFDATHSAQRPGGAGTETAGVRESIPAMTRAAVAVGLDALFIEVHPNPDKALSDKATQWPLARARELMEPVAAIHALRRKG